MIKRFIIVIVLLCTSIAGIASAQTVAPVPTYFESFAHPVDTVASYYNAINRGDYLRAYNYWHGNVPGGASLAQFTQGFADTQHVQGLVRLPILYSGAAGSLYAAIPTIMISTQANGTQQIFAGCFVARRSNVPTGTATGPDPNWYLYSAELNAVNAADFSLALIDQCAEVEAFPMAAPFAITTHPLDTLTAYYDAIARRDIARAYSYWGGNNTEQTWLEFGEGFEGTDNIGVVVDLDMETQGAAGSVYAEIPVLLTATSEGVPQWFAGCYVFRRSNVPVGSATEPDPNWNLYTADVDVAENAADAVELVGQACAATG